MKRSAQPEPDLIRDSDEGHCLMFIALTPNTERVFILKKYNPVQVCAMQDNLQIRLQHVFQLL